MSNIEKTEETTNIIGAMQFWGLVSCVFICISTSTSFNKLATCF